MRSLKTENGLGRARAFLWKRKNCPQNSDRIRMDCTDTLRLLEGSMSYQRQQVHKARRNKIRNFRYGSSLKWFVGRLCEYQGDNLAQGNVRPSHGALQEKLLVSNNEVLHSIIDKDALLNGNRAHQILNPHCEYESHPELSWMYSHER